MVFFLLVVIEVDDCRSYVAGFLNEFQLRLLSRPFSRVKTNFFFNDYHRKLFEYRPRVVVESCRIFNFVDLPSCLSRIFVVAKLHCYPKIKLDRRIREPTRISINQNSFPLCECQYV